MVNAGHGDRIDRVLELTAVWVLMASAAGLITALLGCFLAPQICIAATLLTALYAWRVPWAPSGSMRSPDWRHIALLVVIGLFFRLPAYNYILGGQDEGLYVNMSHHIERTGGVAVSDDALRRLQGSSFVARYISENRHISAYTGPLKGGYFVSGIYLKSPSSSRLSFQFYHLFPVWMALFAGVFGGAFAVYALTLFSLLSIVFMYRLALAITDSKAGALMAGLLLALNPLHAFFSKFPVTEVPALAFSLMAFTFLSLFWRSGGESRRNVWLWLSLLCFGGLFATRISGFMYIPFLVAMALAGVVADPDRGRQMAIHRWVICVAGLYGVSVVYGLHWSHQYSSDIYRLSFERLFGGRWREGVGAIVLFGLMAWIALAQLGQSAYGGIVLGRALSFARRAIAPILMIGLVIGLHKIYQLGWTNHFDSDQGLSVVWGLAGSHWRALKASSFATLFVYLGPLLPLAFLGTAIFRQDDPIREFLRLFVVGFFVYIVVLQWVVPYGPYYARYLLSELVPYMILYVVAKWTETPAMRGRWMFTGVLVATIMYGIAITGAQLGKNEADGLYESLAKLLRPVDSSDVVLLDALNDSLPNANEIKTPILFTFGLPAITVSKASLADADYIAAINERYNDVFVLSASAVTPKGFESTGSTRIPVWAYEWGHSFPHKLFLREDMNLYLYRLVRSMFPLRHEEKITASSAWMAWLASGWSAPESIGVWSSGNRSELLIDPLSLPRVREGMRVTMLVSGLVTASHPQQRVIVEVNGEVVGRDAINFPNPDAKIDVDLSQGLLSSTEKIRLTLILPDAVTPQSLGINRDGRALAIRLVALAVSPLGGSGSESTARPTPRLEHPAQ